MSDVLIYGATGYMGGLCAREFAEHGLRPIVAGRSETVRALANSLGLDARVASLDDPTALASALGGVRLVLNAAGPFSRTQGPLIAACLAAGAHYADLAGEVDEMLTAQAHDEAARAAGVVLLPGAGFGVVPTDLAAAEAARLLPGADRLVIAYATEGGASRGTLKTVLGAIDRPGVRREGGTLVPARPAERRRSFTVEGRTFEAVYNPWRGDLVTAAISTGIGTVETYAVFPAPVVQMMRGRLLWLRDLALGPLLRLLPEGPSEHQLARGRTFVEAVAYRDQEQRAVSLTGPEAYVFTARCARAVATRLLRDDVPAGFQTPSALGRDLLDDVRDAVWQGQA